VAEGDTIQQALNVASDAVSRHDERGIYCVDVAAGHRPSGMTDQGGNRRLCEPKVIGDAGEAVPQNMGRDADQVGLLK